ncbi:MAG TPA: SCO family protein [Steroidobacteraceae bacterium]|nr:SCO family protein [Steroidobacteraceae bacterium]
MKLTRALPWIVATAALGALAGGIAARMLSQKTVALQSGTWLPQPRPLASFQLTDHNGRPFDNAALNGHPSLLFFGYSNCPDLCPATLAIMRDVQRRAPIPGLQFLFITVDPERDTPAALKQYLHHFSSEFVGLSAGRASLAPLMRTLAADAESQGTHGGGNQLTHSATLYLLDTHGRLAAVYSPPLNAATLSADLHTIARASVL